MEVYAFRAAFRGVGCRTLRPGVQLFQAECPLPPSHAYGGYAALSAYGQGVSGRPDGNGVGPCLDEFLHLPVHVARRPQAVVYMDDAHLYAAYFLFADIPRRPLAVPDIVRLDTRPARRAADVVPFLPVE